MLSPNFSPMQDGLGHYSTIFFNELNRRSQTFVLTNLQNHKSENVFPVVRSWTFFHLYKVFKELDLFTHDTILIQYVPFMYNKRGGINFSFCFFILYLAVLKNKKIFTMVHEVNYPFEWKLKSILMYFSHIIMIRILLLASSRVFVSTLYFCHQLKEHGVRRLPVGSNIPVKFPLRMTPGKKLRLVMFGKLHPAKDVPWQLRLCLKAKKAGLEFDLHYVGETFSNLMRGFSFEEEQEFKSFLYATGFVSDEEVSREFSEADVMLAYFVDGLSTRRGSVMAALEHGVSVLSTMGEFTDQEFLNQSFLTLLPQDKAAFEIGFMKNLKSLTNDHSSLDKKLISEFYQRNFSWIHIVDEYLKLEKI
jgi:glycosyltransferase involved in cell wall biosynthesis